MRVEAMLTGLHRVEEYNDAGFIVELDREIARIQGAAVNVHVRPLETKDFYV